MVQILYERGKENKQSKNVSTIHTVQQVFEAERKGKKQGRTMAWTDVFTTLEQTVDTGELKPGFVDIQPHFYLHHFYI